MTDTDCIVIENNRFVVGESVNFGVGDLVQLGTDEHYVEESMAEGTNLRIQVMTSQIF